MKTIELFCGTKSFSTVAREFGHSTLTVDNDSQFSPDVCADIMKFTHLGEIDILWASPPCQGFSVAQIGRNWHHDGAPKTPRAEEAMRLVRRTFELIDSIRPKWWFIENPVGKLRALPFMDELVKAHGGVRRTVTYCQYGDRRMKPTDIWTNVLEWTPRPTCKQGSPCHEAAPRGSRTGTQGLANAAERGRIPLDLFREALKSLR